MVPPCIPNVQTKFFLSETVCSNNAGKCSQILWRPPLPYFVHDKDCHICLSILFNRILLISGCDYPCFQQPSGSVFVGHNTFLHICISIGLTTLADFLVGCFFLTPRVAWVHYHTGIVPGSMCWLPAWGASSSTCLPQVWREILQLTTSFLCPPRRDNS